jgi:hypothetical protein
MKEVVDLDAQRKARIARCDICGNPIHDFVGQCPRIASVTNEVDGATTWHLHPIEDDDEPLAGG